MDRRGFLQQASKALTARAAGLILCGSWLAACTSLNASPQDAGSGSGDSSLASDIHGDVPAGNDALDAAPVEGGPAEGDAGPDPCLGVSCISPPGQTCVDPTSLRTHDSTGSCSAGMCDYQSHDTTCPFGCSNGACNADPCFGMACQTPMPNTCEDATHLRAYNTAGTCLGGACTYASQLIPCTCSNSKCAVDPCATVTCTAPPASSCANATTLRAFGPTGTCGVGGSCTYTSTDTACTFGCSNGVCQPDPCAGKVCNQPPASFCVDSATVRTYAAAGSCSGGSCSYTPSDIACDNGCLAGRCRSIIIVPCFLAGTPITMADLTSVPIDQIKVGDSVLAFDPTTGRSGAGRVTKTFVHPYAAGSPLIRINDGLVATPEHPFFRNGEWTRADHLGVGDELLRVKVGAAGEAPEIVPEPARSVQREQASTPTEVYNLEVDEFHDYFAGQVLVHNKPILSSQTTE